MFIILGSDQIAAKKNIYRGAPRNFQGQEGSEQALVKTRAKYLIPQYYYLIYT